jgi:DNA-binding beta-propeller fold protein YncE
MDMTKRAMRIRKAASISLALASLLVVVPSARADKKKDAAPKKVELVWPLPPDKPRVRWDSMIRGAFDVEPMKKANWLDRVAGIQKKDFKPSLLKPYGVATDSKGRIYVTDSGQQIVFVFDRERHKVDFLGSTMQVHLRVPLGIAIDAKDRVWVADAVGQHVFAFDTDGNLLMALGKMDEMNNPTGVAVDDNRHRVYVTDSKNHAVLVYDSETGLFITKFGERGTDPGYFNYPTNVALSTDGKIYVADTLNFRVQVFDPDYKYVDSIGQQGARWGQFSKVKGLALDEHNNVYVVDSDFCNIQIFDPNKHLLLFFAGFGKGPGGFWLPAGMHIDTRTSTLFVADQNNQRIQIFKLVDTSPVADSQPATPEAAPAEGAGKKADAGKPNSGTSN